MPNPMLNEKTIEEAAPAGQRRRRRARAARRGRRPSTRHRVDDGPVSPWAGDDRDRHAQATAILLVLLVVIAAAGWLDHGRRPGTTLSSRHRHASASSSASAACSA